MTPTYSLGRKRLLVSDDFYPVLNLPHVTLETRGIRSCNKEGIITVDGTAHQFDVVVVTTGFNPFAVNLGVNIVGRDGIKLNEVWS